MTGESDWRKLKHVIEYINGSKEMCLTVEADENMTPHGQWMLHIQYMKIFLLVLHTHAHACLSLCSTVHRW